MALHRAHDACGRGANDRARVAGNQGKRAYLKPLSRGVASVRELRAFHNSRSDGALSGPCGDPVLWLPAMQLHSGTERRRKLRSSSETPVGMVVLLVPCLVAETDCQATT